jgi:hypothetical protein
MKETGIIMLGDHPRLILEGEKTMTRRVVKFKTEDGHRIYKYVYPHPNGGFSFQDFPSPSGLADIIDPIGKLCPYGGVGDRLKIKETWATENRYNHLKPSEIPQTAGIFYLADGDYDPFTMGKVRSALFMPFRFSRITSEIIGLRAERLQEITERDAIAEGCPSREETGFDTARYRFHILWDSLNAKRGYGWEKNPWVWVILFKQVN